MPDSKYHVLFIVSLALGGIIGTALSLDTLFDRAVSKISKGSNCLLYTSFFVCGRGTIINMENAADFQDAAFWMTDGSQVYVSQELLKAARQAFMEFLLQRGRVG